MSQIAKEKVVTKSPTDKHDELDAFENFIGSELRRFKITTNNFYFVRQTKRKLQQVLLNAWDTVDSPTTLPGSFHSADNNANFATSQTFDTVTNDLHTAGVTSNEYHNDNCSKN